MREGFKTSVKFSVPLQEIADHIPARYGKFTDDALCWWPDGTDRLQAMQQHDGDVRSNCLRLG